MQFQSKCRGRSTQSCCSEWGIQAVNGSWGGVNGSSEFPRMSRVLNGMDQLTVSVKVVVCESDPDVPVTVTVDMTG